MHLEQPVLRTASDLDEVIRAGKSRLVLPRIEVAFELAAEPASAVEARLNDHAAACGCGSAAVAASVAFLTYVSVVLLVVGAPPHWGLAQLGWGLTVVLGAALAGKAFGLLRARRLWLDELDGLRSQLMPTPRGGGG